MTIRNSGGVTWNTRDELDFIQRLGRHTSTPASTLGRANLLKGYLEGCKRRSRWGQIDRTHVEAYAQQQLQIVTSDLIREAEEGADSAR